MTPSQKIVALSERWLEIAKASGPTEPPPEEAFDLWYAILSLVISNGPKLTKGVRAQLKENLKATGNRPAFQELEAKPWKLALTVLKHPKDFNSTLRDEVTIHLDSELPEYRLTMIELAWVLRKFLQDTEALAHLLCNISDGGDFAETLEAGDLVARAELGDGDASHRDEVEVDVGGHPLVPDVNLEDLAAVVEGKGIAIDFDHEVVRGAAVAGQAVQEPLARVSAGGKLDRPLCDGHAVHP